MKVARIHFRIEEKIAVEYRGSTYAPAYKADFVVEDSLVIELKSVHKLIPVHGSQLLTYMRFLKAKEGLLLNFWVPRLKDDGIRRFVLSEQDLAR
jgi:GxxExxY protein